MAREPQQMASYLRRGRVDWSNETAGNAAILEQRGVTSTFLITEREGAVRYHTVFFVRRDSPIQSLKDLAGHSIAFQNPYSTSAYFLPAAQLLDEGMVVSYTHLDVYKRQVLNRSINQTLSRTIITAVMFFLSAMALYMYGGESMEGLAETHMIGAVIVVVSSVIVAVPMLTIGPFKVAKQDMMPKAKDHAELARRP